MPRPRRISDEAVLEGTLRVMSRKGPAEFTLAVVAAEVGIAPATLVQRFGDKRGLIRRALSHDNSDFARLTADVPDARGRANVIAVFLSMTPEVEDADALATGLLWLREDFRDPMLNRLARERFRLLRAALVERMPALPIAAELAALLLEAQWQGAVNQWGFFREGTLANYLRRSLEAWFDLAEAGMGAE